MQVTIYTDGACLGNPGPGGYGAVLLYGSQRQELSGGFKLTTNNRMEITAALKAGNITVKTIPRASALLDTTVRDIPELVRASAHYYNSEDELETFLRALGGAISAA